MTRIARLMVPLLALALVAGAKKKNEVTVRFHSETTQQDTATFAMAAQFHYPPRSGYVGKVPFISERDIVAIFPFPAADGTAGCAFQLDPHGVLALDALSIEKRGQSVVAVVNGRQVVDMLIDKRVSDGIITIPRGLAAMEVASLQKRFPTMGEKRRR